MRDEPHGPAKEGRADAILDRCITVVHIVYQLRRSELIEVYVSLGAGRLEVKLVDSGPKSALPQVSTDPMVAFGGGWAAALGQIPGQRSNRPVRLTLAQLPGRRQANRRRHDRGDGARLDDRLADVEFDGRQRLRIEPRKQVNISHVGTTLPAQT